MTAATHAAATRTIQRRVSNRHLDGDVTEIFWVVVVPAVTVIVLGDFSVLETGG